MSVHTFTHFPAKIKEKLDEQWFHPIILVGSNGKILYCNDSYLQISFFTNEELNGLMVNQICDCKYSVENLYAQFLHRKAQQSSLPQINTFTTEGLQSFAYTMFKVKEGENTVYYGLELLVMQQQNHELNLLQQFAGNFIRDANVGIILIDNKFSLIDISDMACQVLGLSRKEILMQPMEQVFASIPIDHQLVQKNILDGMIVKNHAVSWMNSQKRYELLVDSNVLRDDVGKVVGAYVLFKDVSNLRSLEEQVQRSDRLAMVGQIAAGTAHEIRNPLTSIKGFLQVLKKTLDEKKMRKEYEFAEIMLTEIERINSLVGEFLLLSKRKDIKLHEVSVFNVLQEIFPIIQNEALLHGVTVKYKSKDAGHPVIADRELLKQVFLNICKNGIEAMVSGGTLTIMERVDEEAKQLHVEIHDTGPGIPNFLVDKIFDPFFTTKEKGTGLGLSVCQRIVHDISGHLRVSSKGFGTTFTVSIPYQ